MAPLRHAVLPQVLIIGAGPTGLVAALWLTTMGVRVRIIDQAPGPGRTSRALIVHARTLEFHRMIGISDEALKLGQEVRQATFWIDRRARAIAPLGAVGQDLTAFPFIDVLPQDLHEQMLVERLAQLGVKVEWGVRCEGFADHGDRVTAHLSGMSSGLIDIAYVVGCDGAHSNTRKTIGAGFPGGSYPQRFFVADVVGEGAAFNGQMHVSLGADDVAMMFGMGEGRARVVGAMLDRESGQPDVDQALLVSTVNDRFDAQLAGVVWSSTYRSHHRVADRFGRGRVFIAGDAAHIHSPAGGQGMNTGIGDAVNLAWKLASVIHGRAPPSLLETYQQERLALAAQLVATTDRLFRAATSAGGWGRVARTRLVPFILPALLRSSAFRRRLFLTISQTKFAYRDSRLAYGRAGRVQGGDRMPWVAGPGGDNFQGLTPAWRVQVYGKARPALKAWCLDNDVTLEVFDYTPAHRRAGLARDAAYLLRPDGYVALACRRGDAQSLDCFLASRGLLAGAGPG